MRVPDLVGLTVPAAHDVALDAGVLAVEHRAEPADRALGQPVTVTGQHPAAGRLVGHGSRVQLWTSGADDDPDHGGGGCRVPTGPRPMLPAGTK